MTNFTRNAVTSVREEEEVTQNSYSTNIQIPPQFHDRLRSLISGPDGEDLRNTAEKYNIAIKFPDCHGENPDIVTVTGPESAAEAMEECSDHLDHLAQVVIFGQDLHLKEDKVRMGVIKAQQKGANANPFGSETTPRQTTDKQNKKKGLFSRKGSKGPRR